MFAGPNGSGKSTIFARINSRYDVGIYINPDEIDKSLQAKGQVRLSDYSLDANLDERFNSLTKTGSIARKAISENLPVSLFAKEGIIFQEGNREQSYNAAFLSDFLRAELIREGKKMSFETVMSHPSKIEFLHYASKNGYKCYLYFISTASPRINVERVKLRVLENGHNVDEDRVRSRYERSLNLLLDAVRASYRSYVFDNSGKTARLVCEVDHSKKVIFHTPSVPGWVSEYLLEKV